MRTRVVVAVLGSVGTAIGGWACSDASQEHPVVVAGAASGAAGGAASGAGTSSGVTARLVALFPSTPVSSGGQSSDAGPGIGPGTESATTPEPPPAPSTTAEASVPAIGSAPDASSAASSASPPPISGGTLLLLADGHTVAASDPDRDQVYVADTAGQMALKSTITLDAGDEPGRLVQDGAGLVHVALRSAGAVVTIDPTTGSIVDRRSVCPAPRGIAWDGATDTVWVACATGELVGLPASGGPPNAQWVVERDLRDVVVGSELLVSEFRSAEILHISMADGTIVSRDTIPPDPGAAPHMAWRTTRFGSNGMTAMLHQRHGLQNIDTMRPNAYLQVNSAPPIVSPQCAVHDANGGLVSTFPLHAALAFDLAASADATKVAVIGAGSTNSSLDAAIVELAAIDGSSDIVLSLTDWQTVSGGQATAVAFDASGNIVVQTREPAALWRFDPSLDVINAQHISLSSISRDDPGHDLFHGPTIANIACASCHGEGGDDGHVWTLNAQPRRTPSLRGTIAGTAPYHWAGDEIDFPTLTEDVFTGRMSGPTLSSTQTNQLAQWVEAIPAPAAPTWVDAASAARGAALFATPTIGCSTCHSGAKFTNNLTLDVGTGQPFQVPPLVGVGWRAPFLHDGCATTLADRFGRCATAGHGAISSLGTQDIGDLVNYLETL
jgi:mono/diheme cytochrome c family protein